MQTHTHSLRLINSCGRSCETSANHKLTEGADWREEIKKTEENSTEDGEVVLVVVLVVGVETEDRSMCMSVCQTKICYFSSLRLALHQIETRICLLLLCIIGSSC